MCSSWRLRTPNMCCLNQTSEEHCGDTRSGSKENYESPNYKTNIVKHPVCAMRGLQELTTRCASIDDLVRVSRHIEVGCYRYVQNWNVWRKIKKICHFKICKFDFFFKIWVWIRFYMSTTKFNVPNLIVCGRYRAYVRQDGRGVETDISCFLRTCDVQIGQNKKVDFFVIYQT